MRPLATAAALLCALLALPALASGKARDEPFDFELAAPSGGVHTADAEAPSPVLRTPRRFNLVGLRWRGRAEPVIRLRVRRPDGEWSRWQELEAHADHNPDRRRGEPIVSASDPLWVGSAQAVQYRLSRLR